VQIETSGVTIEIVAGDIVAQPDIDAVVNAANAELLPGGGVAGAIHRAAGPDLVEECRPLAPIRPGQAVITDAHRLPNSRVVHCLGPVYGVDEPAAELLASCYRNALGLVDAEGLGSIAFPAISTGIFGYPVDAAAEVAVGSVVAAAPTLQAIRRVRFVLFGDDAVDAHERALRAADQRP
jgi:O-acetyl-ADP-ribose deacetylase